MVTELHLDEVARWLELPRSTVERWIRQGRMPAHRRGDRVLFDRRELETWARSRRIAPFLTTVPAPPPPEDRPEPLVSCMRRGGVVKGLPGEDAPAVLTAAVDRLPVAPEHRPTLLSRLLDREQLSSTGLGRGVALPHPRSPVPEAAPEPLVATFLLEHPVDFHAAPVQTLFLVAAPTVKAHLHLMSHLAYCLRDEDFMTLLQTRPDRDVLLAEIARHEPAGGSA